MKTLYLASYTYSIFPEVAGINTTSYKMVVLRDETGIPEHSPESSFIYYQRAMVENLVRGWLKTMLPNARIIKVEPAVFMTSGDFEVPEEALSAAVFETIDARRERKKREHALRQQRIGDKQKGRN